MLVTLLGMVTLVNAEQSENELIPMLLTFFPMVTLVNSKHS